MPDTDFQVIVEDPKQQEIVVNKTEYVKAGHYKYFYIPTIPGQYHVTIKIKDS